MFQTYETLFGTFTYRDVPPEAFPLGLKLMQEGEYFYRIAEAEKALCDKIYTMKPVANMKELALLLTEDLRIEESELRKLDAGSISVLSKKYHSTNVNKLAAWLRRIQK